MPFHKDEVNKESAKIRNSMNRKQPISLFSPPHNNEKEKEDWKLNREKATSFPFLVITYY
jgi:septin family protein